MEKSIFNRDYSHFLSVLRRSRKSAGLTQLQVAEKIGQTQSFVSKCERGERRIDIIELRAFCAAIDIPVVAFLERLEVVIKDEGSE